MYFQLNQSDFQSALRNNHDQRSIYLNFYELDKPIHLFRPLIGADNLKLVFNHFHILNAENPFIQSTLFYRYRIFMKYYLAQEKCSKNKLKRKINLITTLLALLLKTYFRQTSKKLNWNG
jgi:hypothetical protein